FMTIFVLFVFFTCYHHHRYLHSFPTRRSSDLHRSRQGNRRGRDHPEHRADRPRLVGGDGPHAQGADRDERGEGPQGSDLPRGGGDRKSTRLNSSHVAISYAVFCLKKKKKKTKV